MQQRLSQSGILILVIVLLVSVAVGSAQSMGQSKVGAPGGGAAYPPSPPGSTLSPAGFVPPTPFNPDGAAWDAARGTVFVTDRLQNVVVGISALTLNVTSTTPVGSEPTGATYDSGLGEIFVNNYNSNNVSILSDTSDQVVATVAVGVNPQGVAYDAARGEVFVANHGSDNVSVISDATNSVVATIPVGVEPAHLAYDSATGEIFVANHGSNNVSVISDVTNTVVVTVPAGAGARGVSYDPGRGEVFVTNRDSNTVTVIADSNDSVVATLPVGVDPIDAIYDSSVSEVFVLNTESANVSVIADSNNTVVATIQVGPYPFGAAYDSAQGLLFVTDSDCLYDYCANSTGNVTVISETTDRIVAVVTHEYGTSGYVLTFNSLGLRAGAAWSVSLNGVLETTTGTTLQFQVPNGSYTYVVLGPRGFRVSSPAAPEATVDINGANAVRTVPFVRGATYSITFRELGLAAGTRWCAAVGSLVCTTTHSVVVKNLTPGTYTYAVGSISGLTTLVKLAGVSVGPAGSVSVPPGRTFQVRFAYAVTFTEVGLRAGTVWFVSAGGQTILSSSSTIVLNLTNGTYRFQVSHLPGYLPMGPGRFSVSGRAVEIIVGYVSTTVTPPPTARVG
jgi:YVTN family beta-propeller protein